MRTRTQQLDHINFQPARTGGIGHPIKPLDEPIYDLTPQQREHVCDVIDSYGQWSTDIPVMLGLVQR